MENLSIGMNFRIVRMEAVRRELYAREEKLRKDLVLRKVRIRASSRFNGQVCGSSKPYLAGRAGIIKDVNFDYEHPTGELTIWVELKIKPLRGNGPWLCPEAYIPLEDLEFIRSADDA